MYVFKAHSHEAIATTICLPQLIGCTGFGVIVTITMNRYIESHATHLLR